MSTGTPSDADEAGSSSPLKTIPADFLVALGEFRDDWQRELKNNDKPPVTAELANAAQEIVKAVETGNSAKPDVKSLAERLFRNAVELEQCGKVYDALPFYRKAVQMEPEIEWKMYEQQKEKGAEPSPVKIVEQATSATNEGSFACETAQYLDVDLHDKFELDMRENGGQLLLSSREAGCVSTEQHISVLPPELILYILRWVVSAHLDMRSLEQCAAVCKGMYLCARDEEIWRLACCKVWNKNVGTPANPRDENEILVQAKGPKESYLSWRQMFIDRERVLFNGCYISKTTYLRMGENSFQDQYYRPVQLVQYFRYIRFLPDGTVYMMTNADEPAQGVTKLRYLQQLRSDVLRGQYQLYGSTISIILKKNTPQRLGEMKQPNARQRRGNSVLAEEQPRTHYRIEFRIINTQRRKCSQLIWMSYSIVESRNNLETTSDFDLSVSRYPALWFSPVRSYHLDTDAPLN